MNKKYNNNNIFFVMFLSAFALIQFNANALTATASSINVLELPIPQLSDINQTTGIVTIAPPELPPEINAELQVIIQLYDDEILLETAKVAVIDRTADIKILLKTPLKTGYKVVPKFINHEVISGGADDSVSERPPPKPDPTPAPQIIISSGSGGGGRGDTVYIVKEVKGDKVIVEKTVEKLVQPEHVPSFNNVSEEHKPPSSFDGGGSSLQESEVSQAATANTASNNTTNDNSLAQTLAYISFGILAIIAALVLMYDRHCLQQKINSFEDGEDE